LEVVELLVAGSPVIEKLDRYATAYCPIEELYRSLIIAAFVACPALLL